MANNKTEMIEMTHIFCFRPIKTITNNMVNRIEISLTQKYKNTEMAIIMPEIKFPFLFIKARHGNNEKKSKPCL